MQSDHGSHQTHSPLLFSLILSFLVHFTFSYQYFPFPHLLFSESRFILFSAFHSILTGKVVGNMCMANKEPRRA